METSIKAKGDDRPTMVDLINHVVPCLHSNWKTFGYQLLENKDTYIIGEIAGNIQGNVKSSAETLFDRWLRLGYANTTWNYVIDCLRMEKLFTDAKRIEEMLLSEHQGKITEEQQSQKSDESNDGPSSGTKGRDKPETGSQAVHGPSEDSSSQTKAEDDTSRPKEGQSGKGVDIKPEGYPPHSRAKEGETKDDAGEDGAKSTNSVKSAKPDTGDSGGNKSKDDITKELHARTKYPVICKKYPLYGVIIGNKKVDGLPNLDGMDIDVKRMDDFLQIYGIRCNDERNLTADEMIDVLKRIRRRDFTKYSGLIVTIITHGGKGNTLCGSDGKPVRLQELAEIFNCVECKDLENKPKIFIISACRGSREDVAQSQGLPESQNLQDSIPRGADFIFIQSCPDDYKSYMYGDKGDHKGSPFIEHLVRVLEEKLETQDLEHALLKVKEEVAKELIKHGERYCKQMPSVTSQMRYEVWWAK